MKYLLLLLWLFVGVAAADAPLPDTPAGTILGEFLVVFNSGDAAQVSAFNRRNGRADAKAEPVLAHRASEARSCRPILLRLAYHRKKHCAHSPSEWIDLQWRIASPASC
jgi:hypothetical protein